MDRLEFNSAVRKTMGRACNGCNTCNGFGCIGEMPGMGGKGSSLTFINNCRSWDDIVINTTDTNLPEIGVAPMTGVSQNMGNPFPEAIFHDYLIKGAKKAGIFSCIGDGTPDFKLLDGIEALKNNSVRGVAFIKPYKNSTIIERFRMVENWVDIIGVDIDSYRIPTMEGIVSLEKKTSEHLLELKQNCSKEFIIKGVQSFEDLELVRNVKPDIVVVSNHGGRVYDNGEGIAYRLKELMPELGKICKEVWVDGGVRTLEHIKKAGALGAKKVLIGRPFIKATSVLREDGISYWLKQLK